jgi:hypothetical protein
MNAVEQHLTNEDRTKGLELGIQIMETATKSLLVERAPMVKGKQAEWDAECSRLEFAQGLVRTYDHCFGK